MKYEVEVEVEEISSTTTTTTKKVIEKTKMYNTKLKLVRRRSKKKEGREILFSKLRNFFFLKSTHAPHT